jgi:dTDP-4-dehydrorhamnose reductase
MTKILVLGGTGMLGHAVASELQGSKYEVISTSRTDQGLVFDAAKDKLEKLELNLTSSDYIINCLGITKPHIDEASLDSRALAIRVNSVFPNELARFVESNGARVIQIATDCVFSGNHGSYVESDKHDASDVYGKTKSLGEVPSPKVMHLRVSTIGREIDRSTLLLEWVLNQERGAQVSGFTDHIWNGITTNHFAKIARGIIQNNSFLAGTQHVVPADSMTKAELVREIANAFGRTDISVSDTLSGNPTNRTLATEDPAQNHRLWADAGYPQTPSIRKMIAEIAG